MISTKKMTLFSECDVQSFSCYVELKAEQHSNKWSNWSQGLSQSYITLIVTSCNIWQTQTT